MPEFDEVYAAAYEKLVGAAFGFDPLRPERQQRLAFGTVATNQCGSPVHGAGTVWGYNGYVQGVCALS